MNITIDQKSFLEHLSYYHNITDDEIMDKNSSEYGINTEGALMDMVERDFCRSINFSVVDKLSKFK